MDLLLKTSQKYVLLATIFLLPIAFANISPNPYIVVKLVILVCGVSIALLLWCLRVLVTGKAEFHKGRFDLPVLIIAVAYLASSILKTTNKMEAVLLPGTATIVVGSALLYFLINQYEQKRAFVLALLASGAVFAFVTLLSAFGALEAIPQLPQFVKAAGFTPEGGFLPATIFLTVLLLIGIGTLIVDKSMHSRLVSGICAAIIAFGVIGSVIQIIPGSKFAPHFPGFSTGWSIAIDSIKNSPILGVGPGNYLSAFSRFRPLEYNQSDLWAVKFATATNFYVTALTETGLLGIAGIILILFVLYKQFRKAEFYKDGEFSLKSLDAVYTGSLIILLLLLAFFPATILIVFLLFTILALASSSRKTVLNLQAQESESESAVATKLPALLLTIPVLVVTLYVLYKGVSIVRAEYKFTQALTALSQNDAQRTFQGLNDAIKANPKVDRYHMTAAQVSLLLANSVARKEELSDSDRQTVASLVQTAIAEGKAAVSLNPTRSTNWEILSQIYRAVMPLAKGADEFAIQTASQAIALDPYNPNLRIALGGIYYAKGDFDNAVKIYETAVVAKRDHPNAYYNLAFAYREKGDFEKAVQAMSQAVALIDKSSKDYELARKALEDLQAKSKEAKNEKGEELTAPEKEGEPVLDPKIELPEGAEPPETNSNTTDPQPTVTSSASPTGTATATPQASVTPETQP